MFVAGNLEGARGQIESIPGLASLISTWLTSSPLPLTYSTRVATDDWPYIYYLEAPRIPLLYYLLTGLLVILLVRAMWRLRIAGLIGGWDRSRWHFLFLGAAFLLLEVQNISKS